MACCSRPSPSAFHTALQSFTDTAQCAALFREAIKPLGFDTFVSGEIDTEHRHRVAFHIIAWPDSFRKFYIGSGLHERDPIVEAVLHYGAPITWTRLRADRRISKIGTEALQMIAANGWTEGFILPILLAGKRVGIVSLAGHETVSDRELEADLSLMSLSLFWRARHLALTSGYASPPMGLTARELDVLDLVAQGCSGREIAKRCKISDDVANERVERARQKIGARTRAEAVAIAAAFGLLKI